MSMVSNTAAMHVYGGQQAGHADGGGLLLHLVCGRVGLSLSQVEEYESMA